MEYDAEVKLQITCGNCKHEYWDTGRSNDVFVKIKKSECPMCENDNSGKYAINISGHLLN